MVLRFSDFMETTTVTRSAAFGSHVRVILDVVGRLRHVAFGGLIISPATWLGGAAECDGVFARFLKAALPPGWGLR
jgi:hypothetical protein